MGSADLIGAAFQKLTGNETICHWITEFSLLGTFPIVSVVTHEKPADAHEDNVLGQDVDQSPDDHNDAIHQHDFSFPDPTGQRVGHEHDQISSHQTRTGNPRHLVIRNLQVEILPLLPLHEPWDHDIVGPNSAAITKHQKVDDYSGKTLVNQTKQYK